MLPCPVHVSICVNSKLGTPARSPCERKSRHRSLHECSLTLTKTKLLLYAMALDCKLHSDRSKTGLLSSWWLHASLVTGRCLTLSRSACRSPAIPWTGWKHVWGGLCISMRCHRLRLHEPGWLVSCWGCRLFLPPLLLLSGTICKQSGRSLGLRSMPLHAQYVVQCHIYPSGQLHFPGGHMHSHVKPEGAPSRFVHGVLTEPACSVDRAAWQVSIIWHGQKRLMMYGSPSRQ